MTSIGLENTWSFVYMAMRTHGLEHTFMKSFIKIKNIKGKKISCMDAQIKKHSPLVSPCRLLIGNLPMVFRAGEGDPNIFAQLYIY